MIAKFVILMVMTFSLYDTSWASTWSNRSKVYVDNNESRDSVMEEVIRAPQVDENKKKSFTDMSWLRNMEPPKFNFKRQNNIKIAPSDGNDTDDMTDENSSKGSDRDSPRSSKTIEELEEKVRRAEKELEEALAHIREAEQIDVSQARKIKEKKAIAHENELKEVLNRSQNRDAVIDEFSTKSNEIQQSARLAEARTIRNEILSKKAREDAAARARKEAFEAERKADLEISDAPRIAAAEACFINDNENVCKQSGCRWNSFLNVCDVDCSSFKKEKNCHSVIGIRRKSGAEGGNHSMAEDKQYEMSRICSFNTSNKRCVLRAGRLGL